MLCLAALYNFGSWELGNPPPPDFIKASKQGGRLETVFRLFRCLECAASFSFGDRWALSQDTYTAVRVNSIRISTAAAAAIATTTTTAAIATTTTYP